MQKPYRTQNCSTVFRHSKAVDTRLRSPSSFSTIHDDIPQAVFLKSIIVFHKQFFYNTSAMPGDRFGFLHDFHNLTIQHLQTTL